MGILDRVNIPQARYVMQKFVQAAKRIRNSSAEKLMLGPSTLAAIGDGDRNTLKRCG
jgi:hypothetical protein